MIRKRKKWTRRILPLMLAMSIMISMVCGDYTPGNMVYAQNLTEQGLMKLSEEERIWTEEGLQEAKNGIQIKSEPEGSTGNPDDTDLEASAGNPGDADQERSTEKLIDADMEAQVHYEGGLDWLNYLRDEETVDIFGMTKAEVAAYLNEIWSHKDISPKLVSRFGASSNLIRMQRLYLNALRTVLSDAGSLSLNHGDMYNGPFGYRTCHFDVTVLGNQTDAYCIDPSANTPPTGTYDYYIHEGGGAGTATYAAGSILYQYEYHLDDFKTMWNASMDEAGVPAADRNRFELEDEQSRYFLVHSLVSNCWHAGEIWDGTTAGAYSISGHQEFKNAFSIMYVKLLLADHPTNYQVYFLSPGGSWQNIIFSNYTPTGKLTLTKISGNQSIQNAHPAEYTLEGAEYGIYTSETDANADTNRKATLRTDAAGAAVSDDLVVGTYYVKEVLAPKGYHIDPAVHPVEITADQTESLPGITSMDLITFHKVYLKKESADQPATNGNTAYSLAGAVYRVYRDADCTQNASAYIVNEETGRAIGEEAAVLTTNAEGSSNTLCMAKDIYYVKEESASPGYQLDRNVYQLDLSNYSSEEPYVLHSVEPLEYSVSLKKVSAYSDLTEGNSSYSLAGAVYQVYEDVDCTTKAEAVVTDSEGNVIGCTEAILTTDEYGDTNTLRLEKGGIYYVKEETAPKGFLLNSEVLTADLTSATSVLVTAVDKPEHSCLYIKKESSNPALTAGNRMYSLEGAVYQVYTDEACTKKAQALTLDSDNNITGYEEAVLTTDSDGNTNTLSLAKGIYYVKEMHASKGFLLNTAVEQADVRELGNGEVYRITSTEQPAWNPAELVLSKVDSEGVTMCMTDRDGKKIDVGGASLEHAVYKVAYYDDLYDSAAISGKTPQAVWYLQTLEQGESGVCRIHFDKEHLAPGYTSSDFYQLDGRLGFPLGTITCEEVKAPSGYKSLAEGGVMTHAGGVAENGITIMQIRQEGETVRAYVEDSATGLYTENADGTRIHIFTAPQDGSEIIVKEEIYRTDLSFQKVNYETKQPMADVFFRITSSRGESHIIKTNKDGEFVSSGSNLSHKTNTNGYDSVYSVSDDRAALALGDCGVWFYGTADSSEWKPDLISDEKGAFRYDEGYLLEELPCSANQGMQLMKPVMISLTKDGGVTEAGEYSNIPAIQLQTMEWDELFGMGNHISVAGSQSVIHDTIQYKYLTAGKTYTFKTILMELDEKGRLVGAFHDANGALVRANTVVTMPNEYQTAPQEITGSVDVKLNVVSEADGNSLAGRRFVIFEYLFEGKDDRVLTLDADGMPDAEGAAARHADAADENQTGHFVKLHTTILQDGNEAEFALLNKQMKLGDRVSYAGLEPAQEYRLLAELKLVDADGNVLGDVLDPEGKALTAVQTFVPEQRSGTVAVTFPEFDGYQLLKDGIPVGDIVAFETLYYKDIILTEHKNPKDEDQTLHVTGLHTTATDRQTGTHIAYAGEKVEIVDEVAYYGLIPGKEYQITGVLMNQETGESVKVDGEEVTVSDTFRADNRNGTHTLSYTFDGSLLAGTKVVVFEELYEQKIRLAVHANLKDEEQSVELPKIGTKLRDPEGNQQVVSDGMITLVDEVSYTHLVPKKEYQVTGRLMNQETGEPVMADGQPVTADVVFTPDSSDGTVQLPFAFELSKSDLLAEDGHCPNVVAYETVMYDHDAVAVHADIKDQNQTVSISSKAEVRLLKVDEDGTGIENAEFRLYRKIGVGDQNPGTDATKADSNGGETNQKDEKYVINQEREAYQRYGDYVTDPDGKIIVNGLPFGKYYFVETSAPEGYVADDRTEYPFTIDGESNEVIELTAVNQRVKGRILLYKTGDQVAAAEEKESEYGTYQKLVFAQTALEGIVFELHAAEDDCLIELLTTDDSGYAESSLLEPGEYYLVEIQSKNGLKLSGEKMEVSLECPEGYHEPVFEQEVTVENEVSTAELKIYKLGEILVIRDESYSFDKKPLEGVLFAVYMAEPIRDMNGNIILDADECMGYLETDQDGIASLKEHFVEGSYYYKEVRTLDGYVLDEDRHEFTIALQNEEVHIIEINKDNPDVNLLSKTRLVLTKRDSSSGSVIQGVEYVLYSKDDECMGIYQTDVNGQIILNDLPYGTYYFVERKAAEGYILETRKTEFTANSENTVLTVTNKTKVSPKTGDPADWNRMLAAFGLAALAVLGMIGGFRRRRKEEKHS